MEETDSYSIVMNQAYDEAMELIFRRPRKKQRIYSLYYCFSLPEKFQTKEAKFWHQFYVEAETFNNWIFPHLSKPGKNLNMTESFVQSITLNHKDFEILCETFRTKELEPLKENLEETQICAHQKKWEFCNTFLSYTNHIREDYKNSVFEISITLISADRVS